MSTSLSIAVVGVGGIGSTFAFHLARAGHDVTVVARPGSARLAHLERDGAIVRDTGERTEVHVASALDEDRAYDLVVVTTLGHQVDAVLPALARGEAKWVQFMFNTFDAERLRDAVGAARCSFGMPFVQATVDGDGRLRSKIAPGQKTLHGDERWRDLFARAGVPSAFDANMPLWLRCHVPMCVGFESISVAGQRRGGGASWSEAMTVARGTRAAFAVVKARGDRLYPSAKAVLASSPAALLAVMFWSLSRVTSFRELLATGVNECRALIDLVVAAAAEVKPPLPAATAALLAMKP